MTVQNLSFHEKMRTWQVTWRNTQGNVESREWGWQNGRQYEHILPSAKWEQGLWPGIRNGAPNPLPEYIHRSGIHAHQGKHNLMSSWVLCANLYFPFGQTAGGRALLAGFLRAHVSPDVQTVDELHLEYAEVGPLHPSTLLGESGGSRGSGQTSPDLALQVNGRRGLILIENKLVEHSFYPCSARRTTSSEDRPGNPDPYRCLNVANVLANHSRECHQCVWGRRYWDILRPVANESAIRALKCCPAAHAGYQLLRQHALAVGIARSGKYREVMSCVALDERNDALITCLKRTGITDLESGWAALFIGGAAFKVFTHQDWVRWVRQHGDLSIWQSWLTYVMDRYGY